MNLEQPRRRRMAESLIRDFMPRYAPVGQIVWSRFRGVERCDGADDWLRNFKLAPLHIKELPSMIVRDTGLGRLWLIEIATRGRQLTDEWCKSLRARFAMSPEHLLFLNAFTNRERFARLVGEQFWGTVAWFADEPDHVVVFDTDAIGHGLRPYEHRGDE